jgi:hypothetical protein
MEEGTVDAFLTRTTPSDAESRLCRDARARRASAARDYKRFENLVYALAAAATIALILAIVLAVIGQSNAGVISGVGAVVTGAGAIFIKRERDRAGRNEDAAWDEVKKYCKDDVSKLDEGAHLAVRAH